METKNIDIKPTSEFHLLPFYKKAFPVTDRTVFAYNWTIYTNQILREDVIVHEIRHLRQQDEHGLDIWIQKYLNDPGFRLKMEVDAYKVQIASITDRNLRWRVRLEAINNLTSGLYGLKISRKEANELLKIKGWA